jgi:hypothetical protein
MFFVGSLDEAIPHPGYRNLLGSIQHRCLLFRPRGAELEPCTDRATEYPAPEGNGPSYLGLASALFLWL